MYQNYPLALMIFATLSPLPSGTFGRIHQGVLMSAAEDSERDIFVKTVTGKELPPPP